MRSPYCPQTCCGHRADEPIAVRQTQAGPGAPNTNRTCDLPLRRGLLYPLSYRGVRGDSTEVGDSASGLKRLDAEARRRDCRFDLFSSGDWIDVGQ